MIDLDAPIVPGQSLGNLHVGGLLQEIYREIKYEAYDAAMTFEMADPFYASYRFCDAVRFEVHILNGKILKIGALGIYRGGLPSGVKLGMSIREAILLEPGLYFDDAEEMFLIEGVPGISFETAHPHSPEGRIEAITVYDPQLDKWTAENERGFW